MNLSRYISGPPLRAEDEQRAVQDIVHRHERHAGRAARGGSQWTWVAAAALAMLALASGLHWLGIRNASEQASADAKQAAQALAASEGAQTFPQATSGTPSQLNLADGSTVTMDPKSEVEIVEQSEERLTLRLSRGRAWFDVAKQRDRHFEVASSSVTVRVVGTRFEVVRREDAQGTSITVSVEEGEVQIWKDGDLTSRLSAGQTWSTLLQAKRGQASDKGASSGEPAPAQPPAQSTQDLARRLFQRANAARAAGDVGRAIRLYESFVERFPEDPKAQLASLEAGRLRMDQGGDPNKAARRLEESLNSDQASLRPESLARLVEAYDRSGDLDKCRMTKARYLREFPQGSHRAQLAHYCDD